MLYELDVISQHHLCFLKGPSLAERRPLTVALSGFRFRLCDLLPLRFPPALAPIRWRRTSGSAHPWPHSWPALNDWFLLVSSFIACIISPSGWTTNRGSLTWFWKWAPELLWLWRNSSPRCVGTGYLTVGINNLLIFAPTCKQLELVMAHRAIVLVEIHVFVKYVEILKRRLTALADSFNKLRSASMRTKPRHHSLLLCVF